MRIPVVPLVALGVLLAGCGPSTSTPGPAPSSLAHLHPNVTLGAELYRHVCYYCHGMNGAGNANQSGAPALWGPNSVVTPDNPTTSTLSALAQYIQQNMPLQTVGGVAPGTLSGQQALNVAAYIWQKNHR
jgi:cytochrome c